LHFKYTSFLSLRQQLHSVVLPKVGNPRRIVSHRFPDVPRRLPDVSHHCRIVSHRFPDVSHRCRYAIPRSPMPSKQVQEEKKKARQENVPVKY
jgi:hypothetical protein